MEFYLVSTEHLEDRLWFRDEEDFAVGMNHVAVGAAIADVRVLAHSLMSNHVHFVLESSRDNAERSITEFKGRYSYYYQKKYGVTSFLRRNALDIRLLPDLEALKRAIAYVQMNPVAANICAHPALYPWGTGTCFFSQNKPTGVLLRTIPLRRQRRILHSDSKLPGQWILDERGFVLPQSYVCVGFVESLFRTAMTYDYFLRNSSKAKTRLDSSEALPSFRDQSILHAIPDLCMSLFQTRSPKELSRSQLTELIRQLKMRFSMDIPQLSRVLELSYVEVSSLLDSY